MVITQIVRLVLVELLLLVREFLPRIDSTWLLLLGVIRLLLLVMALRCQRLLLNWRGRRSGILRR